MQIWKKGKSRV